MINNYLIIGLGSMVLGVIYILFWLFVNSDVTDIKKGGQR